MSHYQEMQRIALSFPEATEEEKWGHPNFCVNGKIFVSFGVNDAGEPSCTFKLDKTLGPQLIEFDDRFTKAAYVGRYGWVRMNLTDVTDWDEVKGFVEQSYRLIAPKKLQKLLG